MTLVADLANTGLDACTLNNALNVAQLVVLVALLRWVRGNGASPKQRHQYGEISPRQRSGD